MNDRDQCLWEDLLGVRCTYGPGHPAARHRFGPPDLGPREWSYLEELAERPLEAHVGLGQDQVALTRRLAGRDYVEVRYQPRSQRWTVTITPAGRRVLRGRPR